MTKLLKISLIGAVVGLCTIAAGVGIANTGQNGKKTDAPAIRGAAWPTGQVRIVVPYPPGTEPDVLARDLGNHLNKQTGQTFVVENRPGANAIIGTESVARSEGDGNTLLMVDRLALETNPYLYTKLTYDWHKDLKPVADLASVNLYLAVRKDFPVNSFEEFIAYAKKNPNAVNVATGGKGHVTHLGMASLANAEGVDFTYVPYRGVSPALNGLLAGETDAMIAGGLVMSQQSKAGNVKVLAVGTDERTALMPDVPTLQQAGGKPASIPSTTFTLVAPGTTPDAVVAQINEKVNKVLEEPALLKSYQARGLIVRRGTPQQVKQQMLTEAGQYKQIVNELGIKPE
ncbi:tripartite tricarboxylate transporter substrate binding protein [Pusillimonas sp. TS35]|uniref:Bug family tripartite tricarboxylate transporter substrate binding protein n=1 Tax=Paracandidimonas lactea TaxID=2895524 RepID=UPI0013695E55|nr:tripartite tricarboxylate transporter substrate binding protein [Paracandidimonas lactea]MYN14422.1 tripartite tricarboxylate transporter substrate binding protein [Pusillimonas sp. TS35]